MFEGDRRHFKFKRYGCEGCRDDHENQAHLPKKSRVYWDHIPSTASTDPHINECSKMIKSKTFKTNFEGISYQLSCLNISAETILDRYVFHELYLSKLDFININTFINFTHYSIGYT